MSDERLVEALAHQLQNAFLDAVAPWEPTAPISGMWRRAAREALRQMTWSRRDAIARSILQRSFQSSQNADVLTLAPPDWTPARDESSS